MRPSTCRFCGVGLRRSFVDLGRAPLSNSFLTTERLRKMEPHYPLHAYVCENCLLVQLEEFASAEMIFTDYLYFSSFSETWLRHAEAFAERMTRELKLCARSLVIELASNDGYLLQYFRQRDVAVLGVEPAANVAAVAETLGVPTEVAFFGKATARRLVDAGKHADLICANNVLAHVPDLNDFVAGLPILLKPAGTITVEFPHLLRLMANRQFDTIYHEHFSYFSLLVLDKVFARHGLRVFDVDCLPTHGGSLRIHACHAAAARPRTKRFHATLAEEKEAGLNDLATYDRFGATRSTSSVRCWSFSSRRGAKASWSPAMAPRPRAIRCSITAVSGRSCWLSPSIAAPTNRAASCQADRFRSSLPSGSSPHSPTTCSSCRGT